MVFACARFEDTFTQVNGVSWEQFEGWLSQLQLQPIHPRHKKDFQLLTRCSRKLVTERDVKQFFDSGTDGRLKAKRFAREIVDAFDSKSQGGMDMHDISRYFKEAQQLETAARKQLGAGR